MLCNQKEGCFLVMGEKVRTTDGRVITPVAFVRETGSRTKNWRMAITLKANGSSLRDALESRWAHVWCTEQVSRSLHPAMVNTFLTIFLQVVSLGVQACAEAASQVPSFAIPKRQAFGLTCALLTLRTPPRRGMKSLSAILTLMRLQVPGGA